MERDYFLNRRDLTTLFSKELYDAIRWVGDQLADIARGRDKFADIEELRDVFENKYPKVYDSYKKTRNNPIDAMFPFIMDDRTFSMAAFYSLADYVDDNWKKIDKRNDWRDMIEVLGESRFAETIDFGDYKNF